jgi:hypothetical protein
LLSEVFGRSAGRDMRADVYIVDFDALPTIYDGGCGVIEVVFDIASEAVVSLYCHGSA